MPTSSFEMFSTGSADSSFVKVAFTLHTESVRETVVCGAFGASMVMSPSVFTHDLNLYPPCGHAVRMVLLPGAV